MTHNDKHSTQIINQHGPMGSVMFVAFIGALVYFIQRAHDFGDVLFAFIQALVWPGIVIYHVLKNIGA